MTSAADVSTTVSATDVSTTAVSTTAVSTAAVASTASVAPSSELAYVALGSNLEHPDRQVMRGFDDLDGIPDTRVLARSSLYRSAPVGYLEQPDFVNAVAKVETRLAPQALLSALLDIEQRHGRQRDRVNGPRTLDLDIVLYGNRTVNEPGLRIPHPRMQDRAFVVVPLAEIAPDADVPGQGAIRDLVARVDARTLTRMGAAGA